MRLLDQRGIEYEARHYDPSITSAEGVAAALEIPAAEVFKTLVMMRDGGKPLLVMVPGDREVRLRALAAGIGAKSVRMASKAEAERLTGLQTGGIGALALVGKPFEVYIDETALALDRILVNGGRRGLDLRLRPNDIMEVTGASPVAAT
ncbi:MAG: aminoacyl-tRNA deacylase [Chloroflexi bacterium]|nr:aminoacyl-tRNA deacylase [Chloroflexota bacterium]